MVAGSAWAQPGQGRHGFDRGPGHKVAHLFEALDLTEAQKEQVHELFSERREEGKAAREALRTARMSLKEAIHGESLDEGAIRSAAAQVASLEADQAVARAETFQAVRQILTPEQQAQLEEMKTKRMERRSERRERRRERGDRRGPASDRS